MGHELLLVHTAVVLQGQDHWVLRRLEKQRNQSFGEGEAQPLQNHTNENRNGKYGQSSPTGVIYVTYFEGVVFDSFDDISEEHFGCECVAVVNNRLAVRAIPTVQFHTATALHQCSARKKSLHENLRTTGITPVLFHNAEMSQGTSLAFSTRGN